MSIEDTLDLHHDGKTCVVCGKALRPGEATATMHHGETKLPICCSLCLEAYQNDPRPYLERLARQTFFDELQHPPESGT